MIKREIGNIGEDLAVKFLKKKKYKIIERNFNAHNLGEIDIIARDKEYLCFVEVRLRKSEDHGSGKETVDIFKQRKIIKAAQVYLKMHNLYDCPCRFDVVSITGDGGKDSSIELIRDAFCVF
ncbi:MAG: YraN family protein [Clostridia bacterium]